MLFFRQSPFIVTERGVRFAAGLLKRGQKFGLIYLVDGELFSFDGVCFEMFYYVA